MYTNSSVAILTKINIRRLFSQIASLSSMFWYACGWWNCRVGVPVGLIKKKSNTKTPGTSQLPLRRSLRLAQLEKTNMADAADNVVENTQRSACASLQERAGDDQLQVGVGCSAIKPAGDTTTDIRKRPNATLPTKVPSYMCISFKDLEMCLCLLPYSMVDKLIVHSPSRLNGQRHPNNLFVPSVNLLFVELVELYLLAWRTDSIAKE